MVHAKSGVLLMHAAKNEPTMSHHVAVESGQVRCCRMDESLHGHVPDLTKL